jgi:hypothetical protein
VTQRPAVDAPVSASASDVNPVVNAMTGAARWVQRVEGRHAARRAVRLGLRSGDLTEVIDGQLARPLSQWRR